MVAIRYPMIWRREGFFYVARVAVYRNNVLWGDVERRLDFFSFHLIRWIHGEEKLRAMAYNLGKLRKHKGDLDENR